MAHVSSVGKMGGAGGDGRQVRRLQTDAKAKRTS